MPVEYIAQPEVPLQPQTMPMPSGPGYFPAPNDFGAPPGPGYVPMPVMEGPPACPPVILPSACPPVEQDPDTPRDARNGMFQKLFLTDTWLANLGSDGFGMNDLELGSVWGVPFPTRNWPMLITPGFAAHWLEGPAGVDLPPRVYDAYTEFRWLPKISPRLRVSLAVAPGYYSDFHASHDALRITGDGAAIWQWTPKMKLVLGAAYLDRRDVAVLPIVGISWVPSDDWKLDLVFPKPKVARRIYWSGPPTCGQEIEYWLYVSGELGGGMWAFEHTGGGEDSFSYKDWRVMLGIERKVFFGLSSRVEVGYVFNRRIEFQSGLPDFNPSDTVLVRGGLTY